MAKQPQAIAAQFYRRPQSMIYVYPMRRWRVAVLALLAFLTAGCTTAWEKQSRRVREAEASGDLPAALNAQKWLIDHAFEQAPPEQRGAAPEAGRYLRLASLAARAGNVGEAIAALSVALQVDPSRHRDILSELDRLPLAPTVRDRIKAEFLWNLRVLLPSAELSEEGPLPCWSYRAREIQIRQKEVRMGLDTGERRITYDARPWLYQSETGTWRVEADWVEEASAETERVGGPPRPRYRAVAAADQGFLVESQVPPCHRDKWTGPFDLAERRLFVARQLPGTAP